MRRCVSAVLLCSTLMTSLAAASPDDLIEKINRLEQQIQELKVLKERQKVAEEKRDQCIKAVGKDSFCKCLAEGLPGDITFEQYIHTLVTPKSELGYDIMTAVQKKTVDEILKLREKCVEKGFFK